MTRFLGLLLAHLLYDFHWQGAFIAEMKGKSWFLLGVHSLTWALLLGAILFHASGLCWWTIPFLAVTHFVIDAWKARYTELPPLGVALWIDQALHLVTMLVVAVIGMT